MSVDFHFSVASEMHEVKVLSLMLLLPNFLHYENLTKGSKL